MGTVHNNVDRLLIVNTTNRRRGAEVRSLRLQPGLRERGWEVDLVSLTAERDAPTIPAQPISGVAAGQLGRFEPVVLRGLRHHLRRHRYDLMLANGSATLRYAVGASSGILPRRRLGYTAIGEPRYWSTSRTSRWLQRRLLARVGFHLAVSAATADQLRTLVSPNASIEVVYGGVPNDLLQITRPPRSGSLHLLSVGGLTAEKDPVAAIKILQRTEMARHMRLRFVGAGPLATEAARTAHSAGLSDRVEFPGATADISTHLKWAHALILTSRSEGLPGVVLEASASEVPTVAFDVGGTREVIADGATGRLFTHGDHSGFAAALDLLEADEPLRRRWGEAARRMVEASFLLDHAADRYDAALRRHLEG